MGEKKERERREAYIRTLSTSQRPIHENNTTVNQEEIEEKLRVMQDDAIQRNKDLEATRTAIELSRQQENEKEQNEKEKQQLKNTEGVTDDMELKFIRDVAKDAINQLTLEQKLQMKRTDKVLRK